MALGSEMSWLCCCDHLNLNSMRQMPSWYECEGCGLIGCFLCNLLIFARLLADSPSNQHSFGSKPKHFAMCTTYYSLSDANDAKEIGGTKSGPKWLHAAATRGALRKARRSEVVKRCKAAAQQKGTSTQVEQPALRTSNTKVKSNTRICKDATTGQLP